MLPREIVSSDGTLELRKGLGRWLKNTREAAGISQRQLAAAIDVEYYTFISQLENGRGRIPSDKYLAYAAALGVSNKIFCLQILKFYDPVVYSVLEPDFAEVAVEDAFENDDGAVSEAVSGNA